MHVTKVVPSPEAADVFFHEDEYHTRSLSAWLGESRGPYGIQGLGIPSGVVGLRIEKLNKDLHKLRGVLCARHGFCGRLPPVQRRTLEAERKARQLVSRRAAGPPPLRDLWSDEAMRNA